MSELNTRIKKEQPMHHSVAPKPIQYSYFCCFSEPDSILVCPNKKMPKLSDLEDIEGEDPFDKWISGVLAEDRK